MKTNAKAIVIPGRANPIQVDWYITVAYRFFCLTDMQAKGTAISTQSTAAKAETVIELAAGTQSESIHSPARTPLITQ